MGGKAEATLLTEKEKSICSELSQHFKDEGLLITFTPFLSATSKR